MSLGEMVVLCDMLSDAMWLDVQSAGYNAAILQPFLGPNAVAKACDKRLKLTSQQLVSKGARASQISQALSRGASHHAAPSAGMFTYI
jgi:hypothetical protein